MILAGLTEIICCKVLSITASVPIFFGAATVISGVGLLLGRSWGRSLASILVFCGYVALAFLLISNLVPNREGNEIWQRFSAVFLGVGILTLIYGSLWSRTVSSYLNRCNVPNVQK